MSEMDENRLKTFNRRLAEQGTTDRRATDQTNTHIRYKRYQDEYREFCVHIFGDDYDNAEINIERVYNFLFYHAYRPAIPKPEKRSNTPKKQGDYDSKSKEPATFTERMSGEEGTVAVDTKSPDLPSFCIELDGKSITPNGVLRTKWFDVARYLEQKRKFESGEISPTNLSKEDKYIGYTHLNGIKSALVDFAPDEVRWQIRRDKRIKDLIAHVVARKPIQDRIHRKEKVTRDLPHWELMPIIHKLEEYMWDVNSTSNDPKRIAVALRNRWCYNDSFQCIVRADSLWKEELSDMVHYSLKQHGEPDDYQVLLRVLWEGKTNQKNTSKAFLAQCFRHLDPNRCAVGSKAMYLYSRFLVTEEEFNFTNNDWFSRKTAVVLGDRGNTGRKRDLDTALGSGSYEQCIKRAQLATGIISVHKLHCGRSVGCVEPQLGGAPTDETMILGCWAKIEGSVFNQHYNVRVPFAAMRCCAGAGKDVGRYYLPRSHFKPSIELQEMVWPNVERAKQRLFATEGNEKMLTAHRFIKTMDYLRVVLLQDAAYFMTQSPHRAKHVLFQFPLFQTPTFIAFKDNFAKHFPAKLMPENDPTLKHVQLVVPSIGHSLQLSLTETKHLSSLLSDLGKKIADNDEASHQERMQLYQTMVQWFDRVEDNYLTHISRDVRFMATLMRHGTNGLLYSALTSQEDTEAAHAPTATHRGDNGPSNKKMRVNSVTATNNVDDSYGKILFYVSNT